MRKWIFLIIVLVFVVIFLILLMLQKEYLSIQNDNVYFNMSEKALEKIKGKPIEINHDIGDTPFDEYIFIEQIYRYQAKSSYAFYQSLFGLKLNRVFIEISNLTFDEAEEIIDQITNSLTSYYSNKKGYFNNGLQVKEDTFNLVLGTNNGAIGNSFHIKYEDGNLTLSAIKQN